MKPITFISAALTATALTGAFSWWVTNPPRKAEALAREYVLQRLKCPSTATFSDLSVTSSENGPLQEWTVTGFVDSQNPFGAMVRNEFKVSIAHDGSWELPEHKVIFAGDAERASEVFDKVSRRIMDGN